jgi:hypothetical protein
MLAQRRPLHQFKVPLALIDDSWGVVVGAIAGTPLYERRETRIPPIVSAVFHGQRPVFGDFALSTFTLHDTNF